MIILNGKEMQNREAEYDNFLMVETYCVSLLHTITFVVSPLHTTTSLATS